MFSIFSIVFSVANGKTTGKFREKEIKYQHFRHVTGFLKIELHYFVEIPKNNKPKTFEIFICHLLLFSTSMVTRQIVVGD